MTALERPVGGLAPTRARASWLGLMVVLGWLLGACFVEPVYRCESSSQCVDGTIVGICQSTGVCSFPDDGCESGQRYAGHSGALSNTCVGDEEGSSSDGIADDGADANATSMGSDGGGVGTETGDEGGGGDPMEWGRARPITITATEDLSDYQVAVDLSADDFDYAVAATGGTDLRFASELDSPTFDLPYYIETWDAGGDSRIWVRVPSISAADELTIFMFYDGPTTGAAASNFDATFPSAFVSDGARTLSGAVTYDWFELRAGDSLTVTDQTPLIVDARRIIVAGLVDAAGAGHPGGDASDGSGPGGGAPSTNAGAGGGGHGGAGGLGGYDDGDDPGAGGAVNGDTDDPVGMGSGGGGTDLRRGGAGGGAVVLRARAVDVSGEINVDGAGGEGFGRDNERGGGGGAGGGIQLRAAEVVVTGSLSARGGEGGNQVSRFTANDGGGGGGGGRFLLQYGVLTQSGASLDLSGGAGGLFGDGAIGEDGGPGQSITEEGVSDQANATVGQEIVF